MSQFIKEKIFIIKKVIHQKKWSKEDDKKLITLVEKNNCKNWKKISKYFDNKTPYQCFNRYKRIKPGMKKGSWKKEEDNLILNLISKYGKKWAKISKIIKNRNGKQIRDRYLNILNPNINKKKFSIEEDFLLINLYEKFGSKWSKITTYFENRTCDMIKNRFHCSLKKKYDEFNKINNNNNVNSNFNFKHFLCQKSDSTYLSSIFSNSYNVNNNNLKDDSLTNYNISHESSFYFNENKKGNYELKDNIIFFNNDELNIKFEDI